MREKDYIPQLIVGLDSLDESANYIHIKHAKENVQYYCPCCKGIIKPRAYKKEELYKMQPHFYHETDGCTEEAYIHYICKTFLFEKGSKFIINGYEYEVASVEIEKSYQTKYGKYTPDITVSTSSGKVFFFEINNTSKKTEEYLPKWDELGNDVVEVDVKTYINNKFDKTTPTFDLIYSDGECFVRKYVSRQYEEIERRKLEWKRQDCINYKIKWEKLDWFWRELQEYIATGSSAEDVIDAYKNLPFEDMEFCWKAIHNHKLKDIEDECIKICNTEFDRRLADKNISFSNSKCTYCFEIHSDKYFSSSETTIVYRKKIRGIDLYKDVVNKLRVDKRALIKDSLLSIDCGILEDLLKIYVYTDNFYICFRSDRNNEPRAEFVYGIDLEDQIKEHYSQRRNKRYMAYREKKKEIIAEQFDSKLNGLKERQMIKKRGKYEKAINEICTLINDCKNKEWHCKWKWKRNSLSISYELYFDHNNNHFGQKYNCSLYFTIKEKDIRKIKTVITKCMKKLYSLSGFKPYRSYSRHQEYIYAGDYSGESRKLFC